MSLFKQDGKWTYEFQYQGKRYGKRGFKSRQEGLQAQEDHKKELRREVEEGITLLDGMKQYQQEVSRRITEQTYDYKKFVFEGLLNKIGNVSLKSVTSNQILSYLQTRGTNINFNRHRKEILSLFNWAIGKELVEKNPCKPIKKLPEVNKERRTPTEDEVNKVLAVSNKKEQTLLMILIHTLARLGEALKLKWEHFDFEGRNITLSTRKSGDGSLVPRTNPVSHTFWNFMKEQYENRKDETWVLLNNKTGTKFLGRPKMMESLCNRAGVKYFDFYGLRHFGAVWLASHGVPIIKISRMLGHKSLRTTEIYLKHDVEDMRSATQPLEQFSVVGPVVDHAKKTQKRPKKTRPTTEPIQISVGI